LFVDAASISPENAREEARDKKYLTANFIPWVKPFAARQDLTSANLLRNLGASAGLNRRRFPYSLRFLKTDRQ
jgi:hypothetical protein